jgi:ER membrane protein complex subunit 1
VQYSVFIGIVSSIYTAERRVLNACIFPSSTMRLHALLTLALSLIFPVYAIIADEAYHVDYHLALLGIPQSGNTFFHRPSASSSASLLFTISEKGVLGAVNPKDGSLVWRQTLVGPLPKPNLKNQEVKKLHEEEQLKALTHTSPVKAGLLAEEGSGFVVSYYGPTVSAWDAMTGKLVWQRVMPHGQHVRSAQLLSSGRDNKSPSAVDVAVLYGTEESVVLRLDGSSGAVVWEHTDAR